MDLLRIVVKKRSEGNKRKGEDKESLKRFASRVAKLRGEGPMATSIEPEVALEVVSINISDIEIPPTFTRKTVRDVTPLVASIKNYGIQQPLKVIKIRGTKKFRLVFGRRRLMAAEQAGLDAVPCIVELATREDRLQMLSLAENLHREELNALEKGTSLKGLNKKSGVSLEDINNILSLTSEDIKNFIDILNLPEAVRVEVEKNPELFTLSLLKLLLRSFRKSKNIGKQLFKAMISGKVTSFSEAEAFVGELA